MPSPLGRNARPHGTSESFAMVFTAPGLPEPPPPPFFVLTVTGADSADALFARSRARTRNVNEVFAARLPTVAVVVPASVLATGALTPCWNTSYSVTATLSVDLFQASATVVSVTAVTWLFVGLVGGVLSAANAGVAATATRARPLSTLTPTSVRRSFGATENSPGRRRYG